MIDPFVIMRETMTSLLKRVATLIAACSFLFASINSYADTKPDQETKPLHFSEKAEVFIDYMVKVHHFNRKKLTHLLSQVKYNQDVIYKISHPYESKPWNVYKAHFLTQARIENGALYWKKHAKALEYAQKKYGVPASIIVAIIGVETNYGQHTGSYYAIDALSTLAFTYPKRSHFFTKELVQYLLLTKEQNFPPLSVKSSYAGAIGIPQFMPSTYRHYAVGYASKNHSDIVKVDADAIVSIANYFCVNGWERHQPIASEFSNAKPFNPKLISDKPRLRITVRELEKMGIHPATKMISANEKAAIVELQNETGETYWLVFHNFKVIMKYNPRVTYAMAVYQLSEAIQKAHDQQTSGTGPTTTSARKA